MTFKFKTLSVKLLSPGRLSYWPLYASTHIFTCLKPPPHHFRQHMKSGSVVQTKSRTPFCDMQSINQLPIMTWSIYMSLVRIWLCLTICHYHVDIILVQLHITGDLNLPNYMPLSCIGHDLVQLHVTGAYLTLPNYMPLSCGHNFGPTTYHWRFDFA